MKRWGYLLAIVGSIGLSACQSDTQDTQGELWPLVSECNLHQQACQSRQGDAAVSLDISPRPIAVAKPLSVTVNLAGMSAHKVELDISGINMYMGYNRSQLQAQTNEPNVFRGSAMLAFCTNEVMLWQLTVLVHQADGQVRQIPFQLETRNR